MNDFEVKNCGCNQDPCTTYGSEEEQKAEYEELKETNMRKPSMRSLLTEWRKLLNEHVTDEEHEHPHGDEVEEGASSSETSSSRVMDEVHEPTMSSSSYCEVALENAVLDMREELYRTAGFSRTEANDAIIQEVQAILMQ